LACFEQSNRPPVARTRWKLRRAVALLNGELRERGSVKHPAKTFIGRIVSGFDYVGSTFA
jgi:RNA-directed DNA polymerase